MTLDEWRETQQATAYRGHRVAFRREGRGEPMLLVHGFPTAGWDWHRIWAMLTAHHDVVAPDLLGFGFSAKPRGYDYTLRDQATLVTGLLDTCGVERYHLVAHDYGSTVAQELLARDAETGAGRIASACLLNGGIIDGTHRPLFVQRALAGPGGALISRVLTRRSLERSFARIFGPETQPTPAEIDEYWQLIEHGGGRRVVHRLIRYMHERRRHATRWREILRDTPVPLRLINGLADPISGAHVVAAFRELVPRANVVELPGIGHYPQVEAAQATAAAILEHSGSRPFTTDRESPPTG